MYRARVRKFVLGMRSRACLVSICHQQKRTFGGWRTSSRDFVSHFRVSYDILGSCGSGQARVFSMYPRRWLSLSSRAKAFAFQRRHRRFVGDSVSICLSVELVSLLATQQKWYHHLQQVQSLMPHNYIPGTIVCIILLYSSLYLLITAVSISRVVQVFTKTGSACSCHNQSFEKNLWRKKNRCLI